MCSSHQHQDSHQSDRVHDADALAFRVDDMTCGHCAGTIKKAIESVLPGVEVNANPESKVVSVKGAAEFSKLREIVTAAGYTPSEAPIHA